MASRVRCDGGQMLSDGSSASAALAPAVAAAGAASADPSGGPALGASSAMAAGEELWRERKGERFVAWSLVGVSGVVRVC